MTSVLRRKWLFSLGRITLSCCTKSFSQKSLVQSEQVQSESYPPYVVFQTNNIGIKKLPSTYLQGNTYSPIIIFFHSERKAWFYLAQNIRLKKTIQFFIQKKEVFLEIAVPEFQKYRKR